MTYVYLIAGSVVILTCFYFIISPFFSNHVEQKTKTQKEEDQLTLSQIYEAVNELEMEFLMKKISAEDFEKMKEQYQLLAAGLLKEEKPEQRAGFHREKADEVEDEIMRELQKLRKQKG